MKTQVTTLNTICVKKKMIYEMPFFIDDKTNKFMVAPIINSS